MANEVVIDFNRRTAMGYSYREMQENLVKAQTGEITGAMRENSNREIAATVASAGLVAESVRRMQTGITTAIDGQTEVMQTGFNLLGSTLEAGFGRVTNELGRMSAEMNMGFARTEAAIDRLSADICGRLDKITNILETPRGTAARELYNNAYINSRKGFYEEALPDVQKAVEMLTADYLSWFLEGWIYAFGASEFSNVIDLDKSIAAYTNAAKYVSPDAEKSKEAKRLAAEIRFYLGLAQYAKSNELFKAGNQAESSALLSTARDSFLRSYQYSNLMLEARYYAARCKALLGDTPGALADLEAVIKGDALYCVKTEIESDFDTIRGDYHWLIEKMRVELYGEAAPVYKKVTDSYNLAKKEGLTQYFEKTVQIAQGPADSNRNGITGSGAAGLDKSPPYFETIPLFEQYISEGFDKNLPYLDMRVKTSPYPALLNVLMKGAEAVFQTEANDEGGVTIVKYGGGDTQVVIPASIGGKPVTVIGERAFEQKKLTSVALPNSVTAIRGYAFSGNQLTGVVISDGVKTIGDSAFYNNQLTSVVIPDSVTTIGADAFSGKHDLSTSIYNKLTSVTIGNSVTTIGSGAFSANELTSVVIPGSVQTIGERAFSGNQLTGVVISDGVKTIGDSAFYNNQLTSVVIPDSVTTIGVDAFSGRRDTIIYNKLTSVTIGNSVTTIGNGAFFANQLTSVVIPGSVTTIGNYAFCSNQLTGVVISDGVKTIEDGAFSFNPLENVTIGANVNVGIWDPKTATRFDSFYNEKGKKAGKYHVSKDRQWYNVAKAGKDSLWIVIGALLGLVPLIGGFVEGHWFIGILSGIATAVVGAFAFTARGWGILALALIGGGIALGIQMEHPVIVGIIGGMAGLVVWGVGVNRNL
jgi:tetratricopeptide (TPR) repeat protein